MKILVAPRLYSAKSITGISTVVSYIDMIRGVNRIRDDVEWLFAVPRSDKYIKWKEEDFALDRTSLLPILPEGSSEDGDDDGFSRQDLPFFSPDAFRFFSSNEFLNIDGVISSYMTAQLVPYLQPEYDAKHYYGIPKVGLPKIVNYFTITGRHPGMPNLRSRAGEVGVASSLLSSCVTVVLDSADCLEARRIARKYLSASEQAEIDIRIIPCSVDVESIQVPRRPKKRCTFFYGGTFEGNKHVKEWVAAVEKAFSSGLDVSMVVSTQWDKIPDWMQMPFVKVFTSQDRSGYHSHFPDGDFLCYWLDYVGTGIGMTEAIVSGMTPLFRKTEGTVGRYPDGYPLVAKTDSEVVALVMSVAKDPEKAKEKGKEAIDWTRKNFDVSKASEQWSSILDTVVQKRHEETLKRCGEGGMYRLMVQAIAEIKSEEFGEEELLESISKKSRSLTPQKLMPWRPFLRELACAVGELRSIPNNRFRRIG